MNSGRLIAVALLACVPSSACRASHYQLDRTGSPVSVESGKLRLSAHKPRLSRSSIQLDLELFNGSSEGLLIPVDAIELHYGGSGVDMTGAALIGLSRRREIVNLRSAAIIQHGILAETGWVTEQSEEGDLRGSAIHLPPRTRIKRFRLTWAIPEGEAQPVSITLRKVYRGTREGVVHGEFTTDVRWSMEPAPPDSSILPFGL